MSTDRRSGAARTSQPMQLRETRYMSREEVLRELQNRPTVYRSTVPAPGTAQARSEAAA